MSDYTIEELEQMMADKIDEENNAINAPSTFDLYEQSINDASDFEEIFFKDGNQIVGTIIKSQSENKQIAYQKHHIVKTYNNAVVGRTLSRISYTTGSYSDTLTQPSLQIESTQELKPSILKG